jgi:RNA recognition motif-containing protein
LFTENFQPIMSIYVGNLSSDVTEADVREVFAEYGTVKQIYLPTDRETGRFRGFAFVTLETEAEEGKAIADLDGAEWMGKQMKVNKARPKEQNGSREGGGGAGGPGGFRRREGGGGGGRPPRSGF